MPTTPATKALYYAAATGRLTVAEDSGLEIDALGGAPGVSRRGSAGVDASYPEKFALIYERSRGTAPSGEPGAVRVRAGARRRTPVVFFETQRHGRRLRLRPSREEGRVSATTRSSSTRRSGARWRRPATAKSAISHRGEAFRSAAGVSEAGQSRKR